MKLRHFNIMRILYCLVLALPFVAILSRVIYVQSNKNAYENYSGNEEISTTFVNSNTSFVVNQSYYFNSSNYDNIADYNFGGNEKRIVFDNVRNITTNITNDLTDLHQIGFYKGVGSTAYYYYGFDGEGNSVFSGVSSAVNFLSFEFDFISSNLLDIILEQNLFYYQSNQSYNYIDNVFEYSVNNFIDDNNFGRVNLFEWTTDLFFDENEVNNMYVHFVNWYLNYVLLMSTTYILFLVLMWFVNYSRRLLERGMNYDW